MAVPWTVTFTDNATISTTEYSLPADTTSGVPTSQTTAGTLGGFIDFFAVAAGDSYDVRLYEKVNGGTQRLVATWVVDYAQIFTIPEYRVSEGWDLTVDRTAGSDRSIRWSIKLDVGDTNTFSMTAGVVTAAAIATGAVDADAIAADAVTEIQSGLALAADLATAAGYIDTEVAAIKAKTDLLPSVAAGAANGGLIISSSEAGAGGVMYIDTSTSCPLVDVSRIRGGVVPQPAITGTPDVNVTHWNDTAVATPTTAGVPRVDVKAMEANVLTASALATDAVTEIATAIAALVIETGVTLQQALQRIGAATAGKISGNGTGTTTITGMDGSTVRIEATDDEDGNRSAIEYDP